VTLTVTTPTLVVPEPGRRVALRPSMIISVRPTDPERWPHRDSNTRRFKREHLSLG
jgi:hypothetical protein